MLRFIRMPLDVKQRYVRCSQDSGEGGACFVEFKREETEGMKPTTLKAVSIQALPSNKFVILDSIGDLHIMCLSAPAVGPNVMAHMRWLPHSMKVQKLAVLPDISSKMQTSWVSDGLHSAHNNSFQHGCCCYI
ncbi:RNA methyltransferase [Salix suchowensis]|nr:RNA methyltransferase [Salix suchowensis]